jgi:hypothetical protein
MRWAESTRSKRFSRRTKDDVRREAEEKRKDECTFKPKINSRSRASAKTNTETRRQRFRRLSSTHEAREKHLAAARAKAEAAHMAECTFKPKINKRSSTGDARQAQAGAGVSASRKQNLPDRLHHEADKRAIARQKMRRHLEKQELESFPFKPSINKRSEEILDMSHYKPIHQRVNDIQRAKHASRLAEKLNRDASNPDLTFRPKINQTSKLLVESRRMDTDDPDQFDVTARLMKDANDASARSLRRQQAYLDEKAAELSFQPKISQASQEIISHNSHYMGPEGSNFLKRQRRLQKKHDKAKARKIREAAEKSECTFKPDTGTASEVLRHTRPYRLKESSLERTERLYRQDIEAKKKKRAALQKRYETECTFKPAINEISRSLAKSKSVQELTDNNRNRQIKHQMAAARERQLQEECTFKPATNVSRRAKKIVENLPESQFRVNVKQPEKIVKAIDAYRRDREMKLRQTRQEVEYESMKECTFAPDVAGAKVPKQTGPVVVRGLGRYLELKDLAKRLETEKKHREAKAFLVQGAHKSTRVKGKTVCQPFNLTVRRGKENARREALARKIKAEQMKECTFKPKTTEARNRQLINAILADDSLFDDDPEL